MTSSGVLSLLWEATCVLLVCWASDLQGPRFVEEPPSQVTFLNSTGTVVSCRSTGRPSPTLQWVHAVDGRPVRTMPGLVEVSPEGGNLKFLPFRPTEFRPEVHDTIFRCVASNVVGSVASRDTRIRAVWKHDYEARVYDQFVIRGTTAVLKCVLPAFVRDYVLVTSWIVDNATSLTTADNGRKFVVFPSGELHVHRVAPEEGRKTFRCRIFNQLLGEYKISSTAGRIIVTEPQGGIPPRITDAKAKVWVDAGSTAYLPCAAQGQPPPEYRWTKGESPTSQASRTVARHRQVVTQGTLVISGATTEDAGVYTCHVNNSHGEDRTHTELVLQAPLRVKVEPPHLEVLTGQPVTLTCTVAGYPITSVTWFKDLRPVTSSAHVQLLSRTTLHIAAVTRDDQGMYQCMVYRDGESQQAASQLTVGDILPQLHQTFSERTVRPEGFVSLKCSASGYPLPEVSWFVDGVPLSRSDHRIQISDYISADGKTTSTVNITSVRTQDGGIYRCQAKNPVGSVEYSAHLRVYGPPTIRPLGNITVVEGDTLVVHCPVAGYPIEAVVWEKGGLQLPVAHRQRVFPNGTLVIYDVHRDYDQADYKCIAWNSEGQRDEKTVSIHVKTPPKIIPFDFPARVREGTSVVLTCAINQGDPPFDIRWFRDGHPLSPDVGLTVQLHDMFAILAFSGVKAQHSGNYTCVATNAGGSVSHNAILSVEVPPRWVVEPRNASVIVGNTVTMDCMAEGFPPPSITWKKAQGDSPKDFLPLYNSYNVVIFGNGSLTLREVDQSAAGYFLCQASNNVGAGLTKLVHLTVQAPPQFDVQHQVKTVRFSDVVELACSAKGNLPMEMHWKKDGERIPLLDSKRLLTKMNQVDHRTQESVLVIRQAERNDSGLYTCTAGNPYGTSETNFQLLVQEPPEAPSQVDIDKVTGRTLSLSWSEPFNGHSAITGYIVQYKPKHSETWSNVTLTSPEPKTVVRGLRPSHDYEIRLIAENAIGRSDYSDVFNATTEEEAPGGPAQNVTVTATGPNSIKATWQPPRKEVWNGRIKGYYIGYKALGTTEPAMYKTVDIAEGTELEVHLTNLRRATQYAVSVQAFNGKGTGPRSDEVIVNTLADVPPTAPSLHVVSTNSNSITLKWTQKKIFGSPITECILYHRKEFSEWEETRIKSQSNTYAVSGLECGTRYQFYMVSHNSVGKSEPSDILTVRTDGAAPLSPSKDAFVSPEAMSARLHLTAWQSGGCPITRFTIRYRRRFHSTWKTVAEHPVPGQAQYKLSGLQPSTWYDLQVTAFSSAGATEAQYEFQTLNATEADVKTTVPTRIPTARTGTNPFYLDISVIIPVVTSCIIVVIIIVVGCVICRRRNSLHSGSSDGSRCSQTKGRHGVSGLEAMALKDIEATAISGGISSDDGTQRSSSSTSHSRPVSSVVPSAGGGGGYGGAGDDDEAHPYATPYDTIPDYMSTAGDPDISGVRTLNRRSRDRRGGDNIYVSSSRQQSSRPERPYEALKPSVLPPTAPRVPSSTGGYDHSSYDVGGM